MPIELQKTKVPDNIVIRSVEDPYAEDERLAVLFGNLVSQWLYCQKGCGAAEMMKHQGPARVFNSEEEASEAIFAGKIKAGDVVIIRFEGPQGGHRHEIDAFADCFHCSYGSGQFSSTL
jgi:dihydroxy-acid dehydratase